MSSFISISNNQSLWSQALTYLYRVNICEAYQIVGDSFLSSSAIQLRWDLREG